MCHVKTPALPCKHGMVLKLVSTVPQLLSARVTLLPRFPMGHKGSQLPAQCGNRLPSSPGMSGWGIQQKSVICSNARASDQMKNKIKEKKKKRNSSSSADNLLAFLSFYFGQAIFLPWLLNIQSFCKGSSSSQFQHHRKRCGCSIHVASNI